MFFRLSTDGTETSIPLVDCYSGPFRTACWIIGGGPSLATNPIDQITNSPIPKFSINLSGHQLVRPTFWTAYDPTSRFHRSIYLDPSILKFVPRGRAMDVVPGTTSKVCDCPNLVFFDRDQHVGFHHFLAHRNQSDPSSGTRPKHLITDWQDSLIQAIHIAYSLGFRTLYLAGCEMVVTPSDVWRRAASEAGVEYIPLELLRDFEQRCRQQGRLRADQIEKSTRQYHFDESKPLAAAIQTDLHYFRVAQYLRLSRRAMALAGLEIISVTPGSRLNDHFRYQSISQVLEQVASDVGDPVHETTRGLYTEQSPRPAVARGPMRDFKPHYWNRVQNAAPDEIAAVTTRRDRPAQEMVADVPVTIREVG